MNYDLRKRLRLLLEAKAVYNYGCIMLYVHIPKKEWREILNIIDKNDLYMGEKGDEEDKYVIEKEPHITLLYGLHENIPDKDIEDIIDELKVPEISVKQISMFDNPNYDVLKLDITGRMLFALNKKLSKLPHTNEYDEYHPHITIAYLKKGKAKKYIEKLEKKVLTLKPESDKVVYSKVNGTKKNYKIIK